MASPYGPMVLVTNPRAGRGRTRQALPELRRCLEERGLHYDIAFTQGPGDGTRLARSALQGGSRFVVAVGGDGTLHEVVNGMLHEDRAVRDDAVLGVVATGTGSDFVKTFGMPALPSHAAAHLDGPESFPIDVGKITASAGTRYFANVAQVGLGAKVAARAASLPGFVGALRFPLAFWLEVVRFAPAEVRVDLVDRAVERRARNVVVANGQFFGAGMKIAPKAAPTDGLLDVQVQHPSLGEAIAIMPRVYRGEHVPHTEITEAKRTRVAVEAERPLPVEADGERVGETPASFEVLRDALRLKV